MHVIGKCACITYFMPIDTPCVATDSFSAKINVHSAKSYYNFAQLDIGGYIMANVQSKFYSSFTAGVSGLLGYWQQPFDTHFKKYPWGLDEMNLWR